MCLLDREDFKKRQNPYGLGDNVVLMSSILPDVDEEMDEEMDSYFSNSSPKTSTQLVELEELDNNKVSKTLENL